jgi:hypothetical protein
MGAYAPTTVKNIFKMLKKLKQKFSAYISIFYVYAPSFAETDIIGVLCKKTKKISHSTPILAPIFFFFTHNTKNVVFRETTL